MTGTTTGAKMRSSRSILVEPTPSTRRQTDSHLFFFGPTNSNAPFGQGLPKEDVWAASTRMVFNPNPNAKYIIKYVHGFEQSWGDPTGGTQSYYQLHWKAEFKRKHVFSGYFMKDAWGPYDFYRDFNITFPEQVKLDYSIRLGATGLLGSVEDERSCNQARHPDVVPVVRSGKFGFRD